MANLVTLVFAIVVMASLNWKLTIVACLALPALAFPVLHFGKQRYGAADRAQRALGELSVVLEETLSLSGAIVVKSFGTEAQEARRFGEVNERVRTSQVEQTLVGQWSSVVVQALAALGPAVLYSYGAYLVITQQVRIGTVVAFAAYLTQLYRPAASLAGTNTTLLGGLALFDRVFQFLDLPIAVAESRQPTLLPPSPRDGIAFEHRVALAPLVAQQTGDQQQVDVQHQRDAEDRGGEGRQQGAAKTARLPQRWRIPTRRRAKPHGWRHKPTGRHSRWSAHWHLLRIARWRWWGKGPARIDWALAGGWLWGHV